MITGPITFLGIHVTHVHVPTLAEKVMILRYSPYF